MSIDDKKVSKELAAMYCKNKQKLISEGCGMECCDFGKCLCLDSEQVALLGVLLEIPCEISLKDGYCVNAEKLVTKDMFCMKRSNYGVSPNDLISCEEQGKEEGRWPGDFITQEYGILVGDIIKNLPIIQTVNATRAIEIRKTLSFLCFWGSSAPDYLKYFLKKSIIQILKCNLNNECIDPVLRGIDTIFETINENFANDSYKSFSRELLQNIDQYSDLFAKEGIYAFRAVLQNCYETVLRKSENYTLAVNAFSYIYLEEPESKTEALYLYRIMCRLMELCGCSPEENCRKFVEDENWEELEIHDDYVRIEAVLEDLHQGKITDRTAVLTGLLKLFSGQDDVSSEDMKILDHLSEQE